MRNFKFKAWDLTNKKFINIDNISLKELQDLPKIELCQFTGLIDKNCKEIYEGDIIVGRGGVSVIEYDKNAFIINTIKPKHVISPYKYSYFDGCFALPEIEVIGNIYEDSEKIA